jgi:multiple sugar transport system ATP-binding protein
MVFQNYALYPHMSVFDNIAFPLRSRGMSKAEIRQRVERTAKLLGLDELMKRKPRALSGGQRQRVAMGRAIVREPQAFLMDEPLSNLDAKLRVQMRAEIANLQRELGTTTVYVTHDQIEAMTMGTRIAVMRGGLLQQEGPPQELYESPINLFVATFIGAPAMNLISARVEQTGEELSLVLGDQRLPAPTVAARASLKAFAGKEVAVGIRSEHLIDPVEDHHNRPRLRGEVEFAEYLGGEQLVRIKLAARPVLADEVLEVAKDIDAAALSELLREAAAEAATVTARFPAHSRVVAGSKVEVAVETDKIHLFDLATGGALR